MPGRYRPDYSLPEYANRVGKRKRQRDQTAENESRPAYQRKRPRGYQTPRSRASRTDQNVDFGPNSDWYRPDYNRELAEEAAVLTNQDDGLEAAATHKLLKKSSKERKANPSTQIRSLKNLLGRDFLPATARREKERELAALLFDQQKDIIRKNAQKNLKRYHFIRFVERQKATRTVKKLKKQQEGGDSSEELKQQLHEAEVDLNYTIYAPLAQKYVAIYARDDSADGKARPLPRNLSRMNKEDYAILSDEQKYQIEVTSMEAANLLHLADGASGVKPPMWHVVETKMKEGEKALEALREQQDKVNNVEMDLAVGRGVKKAPDWLTDDGTINPEDLDSDSEADGGVAVTAKDNNDEEMSDGDGGFFEK